jgi:hypothetical protein
MRTQRMPLNVMGPLGLSRSVSDVSTGGGGSGGPGSAVGTPPVRRGGHSALDLKTPPMGLRNISGGGGVSGGGGGGSGDSSHDDAVEPARRTLLGPSSPDSGVAVGVGGGSSSLSVPLVGAAMGPPGTGATIADLPPGLPPLTLSTASSTPSGPSGRARAESSSSSGSAPGAASAGGAGAGAGGSNLSALARAHLLAELEAAQRNADLQMMAGLGLLEPGAVDGDDPTALINAIRLSGGGGAGAGPVIGAGAVFIDERDAVSSAARRAERAERERSRSTACGGCPRCRCRGPACWRRLPVESRSVQLHTPF